MLASVAFSSVGFAEVYNSITNADYEDCFEFATECSYTPSKKNIVKLIEKVMRSVGTVKAGTLTDPHHLGPLKGEPQDPSFISTYIKNHDGVIVFASDSEKCRLGKKKNVNCRDLIEYWLIKYDREENQKDIRTFDLRVVIYEYNTKRESGYRLGFSGVGQGDANSDGVKAPRASLTDDSANNFLGALFTLNLGNLASSILSLNLNLGNLGNYISTYNSYNLEMKAGQPRYNVALDVKKIYANSVSPENVTEEVGLFLTGTVTPDSGNSDRVRFKNANIKYGRPADPSINDEFSFSLTEQINLAGFSFFDIDVELGKPKMLFDINTVKLGKERGAGLFFFNNKKVTEHVNLVGVLYITEQRLETDPDEAAGFTSKVSDLNFQDIFGNQSLRLSYDPILADVLGTNIEDLSKKNKGTASRGYKVKPYRLKLNPAFPIPPEFLGQMVRIKTSNDSPVNIMGVSGTEVVSLRQLVEEGYYLGLEPKGEDININPLELKLVLTLEQFKLSKQSNWTNSANSNQVVLNMVHYATKFEADYMILEVDSYKHIPWRR